ncbi:MAG: hypothetical protein IT329_01440 [Caldilineaceae bacterium]|nr:hypothetical protein [Caldilineaceae bacterium]
MSTILAVFQRDGTPVAQTTLEKMLAATPARAVDGQRCWRDGPIGLAHQHFWVTPEEIGECQPLVSDEPRLAITADVRLDNRPALCRSLRLTPEQARTISDAALILYAYQTWSIDCVTHLLGEFAFAIWDESRQSLFAACDQIGGRSLAYQVDHNALWLSSAIPHLLARPGFIPRINDHKVAEYLSLGWEDHSGSFIQDIHYLPPAHALLATPSEIKLWRYWDIDPQRQIRYRAERDYTDHFAELLDEAVRCRLRSASPVAISLGGGLDSGLVAALAAKQLAQAAPRQPLRSFSWVFDDDMLADANERHWIQPLAEQYGVQATYLAGDECWPLRDLSQWPILPECPGFDPYHLLRKQVLEACQAAGCRVLLNGYTGELLGYGWRYWAVDGLRQGRWRKIARIVRQNHQLLNARQEARYLLRALLPRTLRYRYRQAKRRVKGGGRLFQSQNPAAAAGLLQRTNYYGTLIETQRWRDFPAPGQWERYRAVTPNNLPQGRGAAVGIYYAYEIETLAPFRDQRLVELALAIPGDQLGHPGAYKEWQMKLGCELLPQAHLTKGKTGSLRPLSGRGLQREAATLANLLETPKVVEYGYIDADRLRRLQQELQGPELQTYWLWQVVALELWLRKYWT